MCTFVSFCDELGIRSTRMVCSCHQRTHHHILLPRPKAKCFYNISVKSGFNKSVCLEIRAWHTCSLCRRGRCRWSRPGWTSRSDSTTALSPCFPGGWSSVIRRFLSIVLFSDTWPCHRLNGSHDNFWLNVLRLWTTFFQRRTLSSQSSVDSRPLSKIATGIVIVGFSARIKSPESQSHIKIIQCNWEEEKVEYLGRVFWSPPSQFPFQRSPADLKFWAWWPIDDCYDDGGDDSSR